MNGVILRRTLRAPLSRPMVRRMASQPTGEELGLTGWKYHFNTQTIVGRRNVSHFSSASSSPISERLVILGCLMKIVPQVMQAS